jgi:hypothetical protein
MPSVEVRNARGDVVWRSAEVEEPIIEVVERVVRVTDLNTGQVLGTYQLKPDEELVTAGASWTGDGS